jgi:hypothetical protein
MSQFVFRSACAAVVVALSGFASAAPLPKTEPKPKEESSAEFIRKVLDGKVNLEYSGANLPTVLAQLSEDHRVNFVLDKAVLQQMGFEPTEMTVEVKLKDVKFRNGLRSMLGQFNLTVAIVGDSVLVTTEEQAIYKQLKHRISVDYDNVPLNKAIKDLAHTKGINVVFDPRTIKNKAAESPVTLAVDDVPFEAVIRLMCEMASLKPARMGNVIYITTEDRADKLKDSDSLVPAPTLPIIPGNPGNPMGGLMIPGIGGLVPALPVAPPPPAPPAMVPVVEEKKEPAPEKKSD